MNNQAIQNVYIIDDDEAVRDAMSMLLDAENIPHASYLDADDFLRAYHENMRGCLILDIRMPGTTGLELQQQLVTKGSKLPIIFITGHGDIPMAVQAMRLGAFDFLRKPIEENSFIEQISKALDQESNHWQANQDNAGIRQLVNSLTQREKEIFLLVTEGQANKIIASNLSISERTVEVHRSQVMKKLKAKTLAELVRIYMQVEDQI